MKNNKGFSAVVLILIVLVIAVIGFTGYYVWNTNNTNKSTSNLDNNSQEKELEDYKRTTTTPGDWKSYDNDKYRISLSYPPNWTISENVFNKSVGEEVQNVYSKNASEIFVICLKSPASNQSCPAQININNQNFQESLAQLRDYRQSNAKYNPPYKEKSILLDGHEAAEFREEAMDSDPASKSYLVNANGYTYDLTKVYESDPKDDSIQLGLSAEDSLALFESIKIY